MKPQLLIISAAAMLFFSCNNVVESSDEAILEAKVDSIISELTLEEKVAQLCGIETFDLVVDGKLSMDRCRELMPYGIGHICQYAYNLDVPFEEFSRFVNEVQNYLKNETRAGIPAILHDEAITGINARGATVYPQQIAVASSWNTELAYRKTQQTAESMRSIGCRQALSPMVDVVRSAYWTRIEESYGEDGYLSAMMGTAFVSGLQSKGFKDGVAATTKHFLGYGGSGSLPWKELYEEVLLPHEMIIREAGSKSIMTCYDHFRDEWSVSSKLLHENLLDNYLHYDGVVVSDYYSVTHDRASMEEDFLRQCAIDAINNGNDVELPNNTTYRYLPELVREGKVSEAVVDKACHDALMMKARLGLLDGDQRWMDEGPLNLDPEEHRATAYELASQGTVLLKNNGILPLSGSPRIALVGPNANTYWCMLGDYTFQSMHAFWHSYFPDTSFLKIDPLYEAVRTRIPGIVEYQRGCDWLSEEEIEMARSNYLASKLNDMLMASADPTDWKAAIDLALRSDVVIAALGENPALCGENRPRKGIRLPGDQEKFLSELIETGKPVILVLFGGRPQVIGNLADRCAAVLQAWYPGEEGADAVADIISGRVNPSGKLPVSYPAVEFTDLYCYNNLSGESDSRIAYPFGYGLSYTTFEYGALKVQNSAGTADKYFDVSFTVKNTGSVAGDEIAQVYLSPAEGQPLKPLQLKAFKRVSLEPGEECRVDLQIAVDQLAWWDGDLDGIWTVSPGAYTVSVGSSSADRPLQGSVTLKGKTVTKQLRDRLHHI